MSATRTRAKAEDTSPQPPQSTPVAPIQHGFSDHSFTLQAIMDLQKSVGEMNSNLLAIKTSVDGVKSKVDDLVNWKHKIIGGAVVAGALLTVVGFLISKASEYITVKVPAPAISQVTQPVAPAQPAKK